MTCRSLVEVTHKANKSLNSFSHSSVDRAIKMRFGTWDIYRTACKEHRIINSLKRILAERPDFTHLTPQERELMIQNAIVDNDASNNFYQHD